ncbi:sulfotransferase [uncultured Thiocystis sp.]|uniref:sulfotransferase n=1 Tax=uncultured Thiocystis sp. TaxID=1202134 RepID=UPI0025F81C06|nr:sulfotransferase [uncultured Thiocystis sp.]
MSKPDKGNLPFEPPMLIAGSSRSGTTWVLDVLATTHELRPIFEPLHPGAVKDAQRYAWKYVPQDSDLPGMEEFFLRVFSGDLSTLWTDFRVPPRDIFPRLSTLDRLDAFKKLLKEWQRALNQYRTCRTWRSRNPVIVKCIRANLLLGWLASRFNAKVLLLVRHPGAVVESKLRLGGFSWDPSRVISAYRNDENLFRLNNGQYTELLSQDLTNAQAHTLIWCIENQLPLSDAEKNGYLTVYYEDLVDEGVPEWDRISRFFDLKPVEWDRELFSSPSQQASPDWRNASKRVHVHSKWLDRIAPRDLRDVDEILKVTGVTNYDAYTPSPKKYLST